MNHSYHIIELVTGITTFELNSATAILQTETEAHRGKTRAQKSESWGWQSYTVTRDSGLLFFPSATLPLKVPKVVQTPRMCLNKERHIISNNKSLHTAFRKQNWNVKIKEQ